MRTIKLISTTLVFVFALHAMAVAQSNNITETFKKHFNETVEKVQETENADEKRMILNTSFTKMIDTIDRIEAKANLNEGENEQLSAFRNDIVEKQNELNGLDGFELVEDIDLDDFSSYTQDFLEQANRTVTIGVTTLLLILIILLLL
jgi:hypothetical protein